jgi:hypothetical protein
MVRGEQIGGIDLQTKLSFNVEKAAYAKKQNKSISNDDFLKALLDRWGEIPA